MDWPLIIFTVVVCGGGTLWCTIKTMRHNEEVSRATEERNARKRPK
ncbi:hypothetical protein [Bradyrhizobium diazoefficiens]|nr:hypothetical protein [Bradyrhizobium japonicum]